MAEIAINIAIDKLTQEVNLLRGVDGEVNFIKGELEIIAPYLREADARGARGDPNDITRAWVNQIREVAYRIEDVIDRYMHHLARRPHRKMHIRIYGKAKRVLNFNQRHDIASEVGDIKTTIESIMARYRLADILAQQGTATGGFHYNLNDANYLQDPQFGALFAGEAQLEGIRGQRDELIGSWLEEGTKQKVIALVGMGGLGKTTLAKQVFDHLETAKKPICRAWIPVSQSSTPTDLLRSVIKQFYEAYDQTGRATSLGLDSMGDFELISELQEYVRQKRYVVVFDDVWNVHFWDDIKYALPENNQRSRIIITTRRHDVAPSDCVYQLQLLTFDKAWSLFCKMVFGNSDHHEGGCPQELKELSRDIVAKCDGLPLAIVTLCQILSKNQKNFSEFQASHKMSHEHLARVNRALSRSYYDLPSYLKPCLLYFGLFPKGSSIRGSRLIRQWIAEGFVKGKVNQFLSFEDIAERYLIELTNRNLIQVSEVNCFGKAREYRVHKLMHDLLLYKVDELKFCQVLEENIPTSLDVESRRLSIFRFGNAGNVVLNGSSNDYAIRCVMFFEMMEFSKDFASRLFATFSLLKMVDLEGAPLSSLPSIVGDLFHLKYLSIRKTQVQALPKSIGKLQQLETLDMKQSLVHELPVETARLHKLRNLLAHHNNPNADFCSTDTGVKVPKGLGCKESLQKLSFVELDQGRTGLINELSNFKQLKRLGITKVTRQDGRELCRAIENMKQLVSLKLISLNDQEILDLQLLDDSPPTLLQRLCLKGPLETFPKWVSKLQYLIRLRLYWSGLTNDPLPSFQDLPSLLELEISNDAFIGEQLHFQGEFKKLKVLRLHNLNALKKLTVDPGALPHLEELFIGPFSPEMSGVLSCIQHLTKLKVFECCDMPEELCLSMVPQPKEGPNYCIIRYIPTVRLSVKCGPNQYNTFSLQDYAQLQAQRI